MNVGDAVQSLAGDEEKLQGLRKVGVKITQALTYSRTSFSFEKTISNPC